MQKEKPKRYIKPLASILDHPIKSARLAYLSLQLGFNYFHLNKKLKESITKKIESVEDVIKEEHSKFMADYNIHFTPTSISVVDFGILNQFFKKYPDKKLEEIFLDHGATYLTDSVERIQSAGDHLCSLIDIEEKNNTYDAFLRRIVLDEAKCSRAYQKESRKYSRSLFIEMRASKDTYLKSIRNFYGFDIPDKFGFYDKLLKAMNRVNPTHASHLEQYGKTPEGSDIRKFGNTSAHHFLMTNCDPNKQKDISSVSIYGKFRPEIQKTDNFKLIPFCTKLLFNWIDFIKEDFKMMLEVKDLPVQYYETPTGGLYRKR